MQSINQVLCIFVVSVALGLNFTTAENNRKWTLEELFGSQRFKVQLPENGKWHNDMFWYISRDSIGQSNNLMRCDPASGRIETIIDGAAFTRPGDEQRSGGVCQ